MPMLGVFCSVGFVSGWAGGTQGLSAAWPRPTRPQHCCSRVQLMLPPGLHGHSAGAAHHPARGSARQRRQQHLLQQQQASAGEQGGKGGPPRCTGCSAHPAGGPASPVESAHPRLRQAGRQARRSGCTVPARGCNGSGAANGGSEHGGVRARARQRLTQGIHRCAEEGPQGRVLHTHNHVGVARVALPAAKRAVGGGKVQARRHLAVQHAEQQSKQLRQA
jgi:hypothetical protein